MKTNRKNYLLALLDRNFNYSYEKFDIVLRQRRATILILFPIMATLVLSCNKDSEGIDKGAKVNLEVSVSEIGFGSMEDFTNRAVTASFDATTAPHSTQISTVALNDDLILVAELEPVPSYQNFKLGSDRKAALEETDLGTNVRYKLVIFNSSGVYVDERDYTRGSESSAQSLQLDGGTQYTFVAYSVNSTTELPAINFSNPANRTLATATVNITNNQYFTYFNRAITLNSNTTNFLAVILKHKMSQVTTTIDASSTGFNISAISANFTPNNATAIASLATGNITQTGTATPASISFPTLGTQTIVANPTWINAATNTSTSLNLANITIGSLTQSNILALSNLTMTPGIKYNLRLNITSDDGYLTINGVPCTKINGVVWMQHNLLANYLIDGNSPTPGASQQGYYYQFGKFTVTAEPFAVFVTNPNYFNNPPDNAWNIGTETAPVKNVLYDPCPFAFRMPTKADYDKLLAGTTESNVGTLNASATNYTRAKVYTSIRKSGNIRLTFPAQGYFGTAGGGLPTTISSITNRGSNGYYWTGTVTNARTWYFTFNSTSSSVVNQAAYAANKAEVYAVRCVAE